MFASRGIAAIKTLKLLKNTNNCNCQSIRNSHNIHWNYRRAPPPASKNIILAAEIAQGFAWWWVLWHLMTDYEHIIGEFEYPDPSKWTDEELGIPPLEE